MKTIPLKNFEISNNKPFTLIAGLNVLESKAIIDEVIGQCVDVTKELEVPFIFKASYDKANRSSAESYRGPGIEKGLEILSSLKKEYDVPVLSDVHSVSEVSEASKILDIIQIPAFLCRQTDLIHSVAKTGLPINLKKGQFLSPYDIKQILRKFDHFKNNNVLICERGTSFGYNNLVVDMIGLAHLKTYNHPVVFDVTHSLQQPGALGATTGGRRSNALDLARSAMSIGLAALFIELHPHPNEAKCDGPCALPLNLLKEFIFQIKSIDDLVKSFPNLEIK